ncbi:MAG TPA: NAD(P)-dependent oxidoreductase [Acidimicrobiales bacterium]|jgi:3-hydroxyisobutyrate dehydrogenase-like beta-hydroxyacid dehydrogenase|nr:NAD(P)-dependent oxidoreductase [Acidimicrobiales bacterium]
MPDLPSVGFIGLGSQGAPMARQIIEGGFPLNLWARRDGSLATFADTAATSAGSPAELAEASSIVCLCVTGDDDVEDVLLRPDGVFAGLGAGGSVMIHSTVHPDTCRRLWQHGSERSIAVVDAPVSGGGAAASRRNLLVMVGGDTQTVERVRPVLATFGDPILHLGPIGAGQVAKLVNNFVFTAQTALALETFAFVDALGLDQGAMAHVFDHGSGGSRAASILSGSKFDLSGMKKVAAPLLRKDVGLAVDVARSQGASLPPTVLKLAEAALRSLSEPPEEAAPSP